MTELLIAGGIFVALAGSAALATLVDWYLLFGVGLALTCVGLAVGVSAGGYYHLLLYRALAPRGALPRGWWLAPMRAHRLLEPDEQRRALPWWYAGGLGFVVTLLGCGMVAIGALRS